MRFRIRARLKGERLAPWVVEAPSVLEALEAAVEADEALLQAFRLSETDDRALGAAYRMRFAAHTTWISAALEPSPERRCGSCRHWDAAEVGLHGDRPGLEDLHAVGVCRRYPPRRVSLPPSPPPPAPPPETGGRGKRQSEALEPAPPEPPEPVWEQVWPAMPADGWCGEWRLATDE